MNNKYDSNRRIIVDLNKEMEKPEIEHMSDEDKIQFISMSDEQKMSMFEKLMFVQKNQEYLMNTMNKFYQEVEEIKEHQAMYKTDLVKKITNTNNNENNNQGLKDIDFSNYILKNRLKEIIDDRRLKQKDLAEKLNVTTATMSNIINNRYATTIELGFKIAMILGLEFTDIFYYEKEEN